MFQDETPAPAPETSDPSAAGNAGDESMDMGNEEEKAA